MPGPLRPSLCRLDFRNRLLLPIFLLLLLAASLAPLLSCRLFGDYLNRAADERLEEQSAALFQGLKGLESRMWSLSRQLFDREIDPLLKQALHTEGFILDAGSPASHGGALGIVPLGSEGKLSGFALAAALGSDARGTQRQIALSLDRALMTRLLPGAHASSLFLPSGTLVATTHPDRTFPVPTPGELKRIASGEDLFKRLDNETPLLLRYSPIPVGDSEVLIGAVARPLRAGADLHSRLLYQLTALNVAVLFLVALVIWWRIHRVSEPLRRLADSMVAVGQGDLNQSFDPPRSGELGAAFNAMVGGLRSLIQRRVEEEARQALDTRELQHHADLERKNREVAAVNRELEEHVRELSALFQLNQAMISTLDLDQLFDRLLKVLQEVLQCRELVLLTYHPGSETLRIARSTGLDERKLDGVTFDLSEGITGRAARLQKVVHVPDLAGDPNNLHYQGKARMEGSMVAAPLVVRKRLVGVLNLHKGVPGGFSPTELSLSQAVANQAAMAIENVRLYEKARHLSITDELTGLPNRRYFVDTLNRKGAEAQRFEEIFSLLMVDIDHFKQYNDAHGHLKGDTVLKRVGELLRRTVREADLAARLGGEEFAILLPRCDAPGARRLAEKLCDAIQGEEFPGAAQSQPGGKLSLSIGIATYPDDSRDVAELLDLADRALYRAKERGRNRVEAYRSLAVA